MHESRMFQVGDTVRCTDGLHEVTSVCHTVTEVIPGGFVKLNPPSAGLAYCNVGILVLVTKSDTCQRCMGTGRICCVCRSSEEECQCPTFAEGADCPYCGSGGKSVKGYARRH